MISAAASDAEEFDSSDGYAHTVGSVCKYNIATADVTLVIQQVARTSKLSSCVAKIVDMSASRSIKKTNSTTCPQNIIQVEFGLEGATETEYQLVKSTCHSTHNESRQRQVLSCNQCTGSDAVVNYQTQLVCNNKNFSDFIATFQSHLCCKLLQHTVCQILWKLINISRNYSEIKKGEFFLENGV